MLDPNVLFHAYRAWRRNRRGAKAEPEARYLRDLLGPDDVCLHVGASDGRHAYVMAMAAPDARIHAFEPSGFVFRVLNLVLAWHGLARRVVTVNAAVSDAPGELLLVTPVKSSGRMGRSLAFIGAAGAARTDIARRGQRVEPTRVIRLDDYCAEHGVDRVDFIRMDIEGSEQRALAGALGIIDRDLPNVLIEIHPVILREQFAGDSGAVVQLFLSRGYLMFEVAEDGLVPCRAAREDLPWKDYFFVHPSRDARIPPGPFKDLLAAHAASREARPAAGQPSSV
jgi:FkbM family methyltransferase